MIMSGAQSFLEGFYMDREMQAKVKNDEAIAQIHQVEGQRELQSLQQEKLSNQVMSQMFGSPEAAQSSSDSAKLMEAGKALMRVNPKLGLDFMNRGSEVGARQVTQRREAMQETARQDAQVGSLAVGVMNAKPEEQQTAYEEMLRQMDDQGIERSPRMTGDVKQDLPFIRAKALLSQKPATVEDNILKMQAADQRAQSMRDRQTDALTRTMLAQERLQLARQAEAERERENKERDARAAKARAGVHAKSASSVEQGTATDIAKDYPVFQDMDAPIRRKYAEVAADRAKARMTSGEEDAAFADLVQEEMEKMVTSGEVVPAQKGKFGLPSWVPGLGGMPAGGAQKGATHPQQTAAGKIGGGPTLSPEQETWVANKAKATGKTREEILAQLQAAGKL
jgi:hypothetical protein